jgi:thiol-disulfide isomerase/thioredoxin
MWKIILTLLFVSNSLQTYSQANSTKESKLLVNLHNAPFTSLALLDYRDLHNVIIHGKHVDQFKWEFSIPDSIAANSEFMMLVVPQKDTASNAYRQVRFKRTFGNKENTIANIGVQDKINSIEATYKGKTLFENENVASFLGLTDSIVNGDLICDDFNLSIKDDNSDITIRSIDPYYAWFNSGTDKLSYDDHLKSYIALATRYPDSRYLMTYLALNLSRFKTRLDVKKIYEKFSAKQKKSNWGYRIERFLTNHSFQNIPLINLDSKNVEPLVQDSSKYNLIVFSASWCGPCIEEIPLLKELYGNLKSRFNFTYVSMDYEKKVKLFQNILVKNNISWRTLYAYGDLDKVTDLFSVKTIPRTLLVYPDGTVEVLDVRDKENQKKLYKLK